MFDPSLGNWSGFPEYMEWLRKTWRTDQPRTPTPPPARPRRLRATSPILCRGPARPRALWGVRDVEGHALVREQPGGAPLRFDSRAGAEAWIDRRVSLEDRPGGGPGSDA